MSKNIYDKVIDILREKFTEEKLTEDEIIEFHKALTDCDGATEFIDKINDFMLEDRFELLNYDYYGLKIYKLGRIEYAVGTQDEADTASKEVILQSVWAFNPDFLSTYIGLSEKLITKIQEACCESCNDDFIKLLRSKDNVDDFVEAAISADGRGHFLSQYNGEEIDSDSVDGLPNGLVAFRIN